MIVYIREDKIVDAATEQIIETGYQIFKEAVRQCRRRGWKWYYIKENNILDERDLMPRFAGELCPRLPQKYVFDQKLRKAIQNVLSKSSNGYVPRPYITARSVALALYRRGDGHFFGFWFVYDGHKVSYCCGDERSRALWTPPE